MMLNSERSRRNRAERLGFSILLEQMRWRFSLRRLTRFPLPEFQSTGWLRRVLSLAFHWRSNLWSTDKNSSISEKFARTSDTPAAISLSFCKPAPIPTKGDTKQPRHFYIPDSITDVNHTIQCRHWLTGRPSCSDLHDGFTIRRVISRSGGVIVIAKT